MKVIMAPNSLEQIDEPAIFLAGSIEMGTAERWQDQVTETLEKAGFKGTVLNPRRSDWDSSWEQKIENNQFRQQVEWELKALDMADHVIFYFDPKTKSPVTLLELGLHAPRPGKVLVVCPEGYWRKGNVDIVCKKYGVPQLNSLLELLTYLEAKITSHIQ